MHRLSVVAAAAIALAGCSQPSGTTTITSNSASGTTTVTTTGGPPPSAASLGIQPGKWETVVTITDSKTTGCRRACPCRLKSVHKRSLLA